MEPEAPGETVPRMTVTRPFTGVRGSSGLTVEETAGILGVSPDTVARDWRLARLWLLRQMDQAELDGKN